MVTFLDELIDDTGMMVSFESSCKTCKESDTDDELDGVLDDVDEDDDDSAEKSCKRSKRKTAKEAYSEWVASREDIANENFIKSAIDMIVKKFQDLCDWFHKKIMGLSDNNPLKKVYVKFSKRAKEDLEKAKQAKTQEHIDHLNEELSKIKTDLKEELAKLGTTEKKFKEAIAQINRSLPPYKHINHFEIRKNEFERTLSKKMMT